MKPIYIVTYNISYSCGKNDIRTSSGVYEAYSDRKTAEYAMLCAQYKIREQTAEYICEHIKSTQINAVSIEVKIVEAFLK